VHGVGKIRPEKLGIRALDQFAFAIAGTVL
jgi:hypothetical protein